MVAQPGSWGTQYAQRPVKVNGDGTAPASIATALAADPNIYGMLAPGTHGEPHQHEPAAAPAAGSGRIESLIVSMPDGRRLLITPLD